ncbi:hypothetical protein BSKO_09875 [Bryopsis sp. KO-2023]|nr:hypothetical protein BSKO_09875 [Bryopsis sp. KO-2023]
MDDDRGEIMDALPDRLPLLALFDEVLLPSAVAQVRISSKSTSSAGLIQHLSSSSSNAIYVAVVPVTTENAALAPAGEEERLQGMHSIGIIGRVLQLGKVPEAGESTIMVEGISRIRVSGLKKSNLGNFHTVAVQIPRQTSKSSPAHGVARLLNPSNNGQSEQVLGEELLAKTKILLDLLVQQRGASSAAPKILEALQAMPSHRAADMVAGLLAADFKDKLAVLNAVDHVSRINLALGLLKRVTSSVLQSGSSRNGRIQRQLASTPRTLIRKMDVPRQSDDSQQDDIAELLTKLKEANPPQEVLTVGNREASRLQRTGEHHPGYAMSRAFLEVLSSLPWSNFSEGSYRTLHDTRGVLDSAHYGLDKVKDRIVQYVAVQRLQGLDARSPILCFVGPPGVGKTSLARSVAEVLGKPFVRISLGGVRDEAEIRGHRKTYVGAMPGRVINGIRRAGVRDPVMLLDEVDKMGHDFRGDPSSALLEVLDPEQNNAFVDTYLGLPFDLSRVVFISTANRASEIPPPLLDRLEVIQLPGYTVQEKVMIGQKHLLPKVLKEHGLDSGTSGQTVRFSDGVLERIVQDHTREAGVRGLERCLAAICRYCATGIVSQREKAEGSFSEEGSLRCHSEVKPNKTVDGGTFKVWENEWQLVHHHREHHPSQSRCALQTEPTQPESHSHDIPVGDRFRNALELEGNEKGGPSPSEMIVDVELIERVLGPPKYIREEAMDRISGPGISAGLVWTPVGGMVQYVEGCCTSYGHPDKLGQLTLTGQAGDVLEESAMIALSWVRSNAMELGLLPFGFGRKLGKKHNIHHRDSDPEVCAASHHTLDCSAQSENSATISGDSIPVMHWDVHVHLPAGAIPKDGPSAGVTIASVLISLFSGKPLRSDTAMTGELTLRGLVLPVGGVKEKVLAAHECGVKRVILPRRNVRDVEIEVPADVRDAMEVIGVDKLEDLLASAFDPPYLLHTRAML